MTTIVQKQKSPALLRGTLSWSVSKESMKEEALTALHPVLHFYPRHLFKVLHVVSHHRQTIVQCSSTNQYVEVANVPIHGLFNLPQSTTYLGVLIKHITYGKNGCSLPKNFRFLNMPFVVIAIISTKGQLSQRYLRNIQPLPTYSTYMLRHTIATLKPFNPCTGIKNVLLHNCQSSKFTSRSTSFSRHSLIAASIRAASSGLSDQQPQRLSKSRSFSVSVSSVTSSGDAMLALSSIDSLNSTTSSSFNGILNPRSIPQYGAAFADGFLNTFVFIILTFLYVSGCKITK